VTGRSGPAGEGILEAMARAAREFLYGMTTYETVRYACEARARLEAVFLLITMGDFLGVPVLPPYYALRLVPHVISRLEPWKRLMLREKDVTDAIAG
jgi:hypothetical protein